MPTCQPVCSTVAHAAWKTPRFAGVAGSTAVMLTANRTAAAAPTRPGGRGRARSAACSRTATAAPTRRAAPVAIAPSCGCRNTRSPARTRVIARRTCGEQRAASPTGRPPPWLEQHRGEQHQPASTTGAIAAISSAFWWPLNRSTRREHHGAEDDQRDDVHQCLGDDRSEHDRQVSRGRPGPPRDDQRARGLTEAGGQRRGHQHADEGPLHRVGHPDPPVGQGGAEDRVPRERAQRPSRRTSRARPSSTKRRARVDQRVDDVADADLLQRQTASSDAGERDSGQRRPGAAERAAAARGGAAAARGWAAVRAGDVRLEVRGASADPDRERAPARPAGAGVAIASS